MLVFDGMAQRQTNHWCSGKDFSLVFTVKQTFAYEYYQVLNPSSFNFFNSFLEYEYHIASMELYGVKLHRPKTKKNSTDYHLYSLQHVNDNDREINLSKTRDKYSLRVQ